MIAAGVLEKHGLKPEEYDRIVELMGREPNETELGLFSVMWSEHCSYKSSRKHLKTLPTEGPRVVQGPGENAGAVDIGDGLAAVFKIESHNHPSFIEPYQGAATGVGGILRDIFTMGARPIAVMNSLRFGPLEAADTRRVLPGVVAGIGGYGNSFGCPTVGGEAVFDPRYRGNPLVNAFCLGIVEKDGIFLGRAEGVGNPVLYVGARTGRDGIHGATMASAEFGEGSEEKRPTVQVGDPFMEKVLLEACLEALATGAVVGIQDMGAAGLSCSSSEMAARAGNGAEIDIDRVPQRETGMSAYEVMLSESQERMLLVAAKGRESEVQRIFEKWDLHAEAIGTVTADGRLRIVKDGKVEADVPVTALTDEAPAYDRPWVDAPPPEAAEDPLDVPVPDDLGATLETLLASPSIACKRWIWRQYDSTIRSNTLLGPGSDAAVLRIKGTRRALAMSLDGNGRYVYLDPLMGAKLAVAEACRNVVAAGGRPIAATNCLNFGNPEKPPIMGQLALAIQGIGEACRAFDVPITGGNVSLYNETDGEAIYPTPTMGVVGLLEDAEKRVPSGFQRDGDHVLLLGETAADLGGSEYLAVVHGKVCGPPPSLDLGVERRLYDAVLDCAEAGLLRSAHDPSDGGVAVALAECAMTADGPTLGGRFALPGDGRPDVLLFSESPSRMLVSTPDPDAVEKTAKRHGVPCHRLGTVGGDALAIEAGRRTLLERPLANLHRAWMRLERELGSP